MKIYRSTFAPLTKAMPDGTTKPVLFTLMKFPTSSLACMMPLTFADGGPPVMPPPPPPPPIATVIMVHPDRWDAFYMAINQPDVFAHPEVRALLLGARITLAEMRAACEGP